MAQRQERNAAKSRMDILEAAEHHFAEKGYFGARIDDIAESAHINKRMIYAYFGNKEALYRSVLFEVYKRLEGAEQALIAEQITGAPLIRRLIAMYFDFLQQNPTFVNILMWENLCKAEHLATLPISEVERPTLSVFMAEIQKGKDAGTFRATLDERQVAISLITVCFANFSNRYTLSRLFGCDLTSADMIQSRKQHTIDMMLTYMQP